MISTLDEIGVDLLAYRDGSYACAYRTPAGEVVTLPPREGKPAAALDCYEAASVLALYELEQGAIRPLDEDERHAILDAVLEFVRTLPDDMTLEQVLTALPDYVEAAARKHLGVLA